MEVIVGGGLTRGSRVLGQVPLAGRAPVALGLSRRVGAAVAGAEGRRLAAGAGLGGGRSGGRAGAGAAVARVVRCRSRSRRHAA